MLHKLFLFVFLLCVSPLQGQYISEVFARWNDSYNEWEIISEDSDFSGELRLLDQNSPTRSRWRYSVEEQQGSISTQFSNDDTQWQVQGDGVLTSFKRMWRGDNRKWRIQGNGMQLTFKQKYGNNSDEWICDSDTYGKFELYRPYQGYHDHWLVEDQLSEDVPFQMKMAMLFITLFYSAI